MKYLLVIITGLIFNTLSVYSYSETLHQLKERYEIIEKELELYHVELEKIVNRKDSSLVDYEKLAYKTWQLKKILEDLDQKLKANHNALDKNKNPLAFSYFILIMNINPKFSKGFKYKSYVFMMTLVKLGIVYFF